MFSAPAGLANGRAVAANIGAALAIHDHTPVTRCPNSNRPTASKTNCSGGVCTGKTDSDRHVLGDLIFGRGPRIRRARIPAVTPSALRFPINLRGLDSGSLISPYQHVKATAPLEPHRSGLRCSPSQRTVPLVLAAPWWYPAVLAFGLDSCIGFFEPDAALL
jgi:hypothetical protein